MRIQRLMMIVTLLCYGPIVSMEDNKEKKTLDKFLETLVESENEKDFPTEIIEDNSWGYYMNLIRFRSIAQAVKKSGGKFHVDYMRSDKLNLYKTMVEHLLETAELTNDNNEEVQKIFEEFPLEGKLFVQNIFLQKYPNLLSCVQEIPSSNKKCLFAVSKYKYLAIAYQNSIDLFVKEENGQYKKKTNFGCGAPILGVRMVVVGLEHGDGHLGRWPERAPKEIGQVVCIVLVDEKNRFASLLRDPEQQILAFDCDKGKEEWGVKLEYPITNDQFDADGFCVAVTKKRDIDFYHILTGEFITAHYEGKIYDSYKHPKSGKEVLKPEKDWQGVKGEISVEENIKKIRLLDKDPMKAARRILAVKTEEGLRLYSPINFCRFQFDDDEYKNRDFSVVNNGLFLLGKNPKLLDICNVEGKIVKGMMAGQSDMIDEGGMIKDDQKKVFTKELKPSWLPMEGTIENVSSNKAGEILIQRTKQGWFFAQKSFAFWDKNYDTRDLSVNWDAVTLVDNGGVFCFKDNKVFFLNSLDSLTEMIKIAQAQKSGTLSTLRKSIDEDIKEKASPQSSWSSWIKPIKRYVIPTAIAATTAFGLYRGMQYWNKSKQLKGIEN